MKINWREFTYVDALKSYSVDIISLYGLTTYISIWQRINKKWQVTLYIEHDLMTDPIDDQIESFDTVEEAKEFVQKFMHREMFIFGKKVNETPLQPQ